MKLLIVRLIKEMERFGIKLDSEERDFIAGQLERAYLAGEMKGLKEALKE